MVFFLRIFYRNFPLQEVLQYLFDELVSFRVSNDEDPVFPVRRETEQ